MESYLAIFIPAFTALFVIIDPIGLAPIFGGLTEGTDKKHQRAMAMKGTLVGGLILVFFAFAGKPFLNALGISMDALRVAGGFMLFIIALEMVFEKRTERKQESAEKMEHTFEDISVFPLAIPLLAGPGAIATIMLLMADQQDNIIGQTVVMVALLIVIVASFLAFLLASRLMGWMGETLSSVITRVLGIILAALAAQYMMDGMQNTFFS